MQDEGKGRPSPRAFLANLGGDMPLRQKARLLVRNNLMKIVRLKNCCGHHGEPGC